MSQINPQLPARLLSKSEILKPVRSVLGDRGLTALLLGCWRCKAHSNSALQLLCSFCLHPLPACSARGYQPVALCSVSAGRERQVRELFPRSRDQKDLDFVPAFLPGVTEKPAAVLTQHPVQLLLLWPCWRRSQAVTDRARRHCLQRRKLLSCP